MASSVNEAAMVQLSAWLAEGHEALEAQRYAEAAAAFGQATAALPGEWALHQMTANAWRLAGDVVRERTALRAAFELARPTEIDALYALGTALLESGAPTQARACFEGVVARRPRDAAALSALASARRADGDPEGAWSLVQRALTIAPQMPALVLTAAQVRHALGDHAGARSWLMQAEQIRPGHPLQQTQLAFSLLMGGPCSAGWAAFESRGRPDTPQGARDWHGESLVGESIAVVMEQGLGDLFHFVRYVRRLEARGAARVVVECPPSAVSLLAASGFDVVPRGQLPPTVWSVPLLSLPHRLESNTDTASDLVPYLRLHESGTGGGTRAQSTATPRVGIVWKGNPAFLSTALRDLEMPALHALMDLPGIEWVWLQLGEDPPEPRHDVVVHAPHLSGDWYDTARTLDTLDLLIAVDTATAHLAGAMGIPTIVLLPFTPDWRWGWHGDRCIWYPHVRLARQPSSRDWRGAVRVAHTLVGEIIGFREVGA
ncbi:tetratricopeptide repeat protein [Gemmatimonas sp.]|jgi:Flp pilus assembly protein TadD|uniref:tetratricopeptide repeat protein n=1 Tax=Gemmatimonas sp. TaxID=1962908 RepID=UPI0037BE4049